MEDIIDSIKHPRNRGVSRNVWDDGKLDLTFIFRAAVLELCDPSFLAYADSKAMARFQGFEGDGPADESGGAGDKDEAGGHLTL
ncbi:uncharacterized protein CDV56_107561 [Aspergillus thermomutatus]|uniref:Uncharacterized protein n=1 Tax=Aspergillus thermomutatus TaxID=41047 RepID=A0A397HWD6_ASPTH|nr:uncharacterized protein CDV56_107561 [Aspergillus thermomutatus]RHZ65504.1 hypothetical protein CDV56_107561 [Aspergillus thermomutatus]